MLQTHDATGKAVPLGLGGLIAAGSMSGLVQCCEEEEAEAGKKTMSH